MSDELSERTSLLGRQYWVVGDKDPRKNESHGGGTLQRLALGLLGCVFLLVGWKTCRSQPVVPSDQGMGVDTGSFDRIFHDWEHNLYKRSQLIPWEQRTMHNDATEQGDLIYFNHSKAFDMLESTRPSLTRDFFLYQQGWDAQLNQAYCGVASSMAVLNSLRGKITLPQDPIYEPFPWATQPTLIRNDCVRQNVYDVDQMKNQFWGMGLVMATTFLNCHLQGQGFVATAYPVDPNITTVHEIRSIFIQALQDDDTRIIINYDRGGITQGPMGHGHFSPIGAYNEKKDAFLIMDMAKYKYPPVWVPTSKLWNGIGTWDYCALFQYPDHPLNLNLTSYDQLAQLLQCQAMNRGYILITKESGSSSSSTSSRSTTSD